MLIAAVVKYLENNNGFTMSIYSLINEIMERIKYLSSSFKQKA